MQRGKQVYLPDPEVTAHRLIKVQSIATWDKQSYIVKKFECLNYVQKYILTDQQEKYKECLLTFGKPWVRTHPPAP